MLGHVAKYQDDPYLFEVKDFRGHAIANKARDLAELPLEIGLKARDTIAGLVGLVSKDANAELPYLWINAVRQQGRTVRVVALIAEDNARPGEARHKREARQSERLNGLKQRTAWLTARVVIKDPLRDPLLPQLVAESLAEQDSRAPGDICSNCRLCSRLRVEVYLNSELRHARGADHNS